MHLSMYFCLLQNMPVISSTCRAKISLLLQPLLRPQRPPLLRDVLRLLRGLRQLHPRGLGQHGDPRQPDEGGAGQHHQGRRHPEAAQVADQGGGDGAASGEGAAEAEGRRPGARREQLRDPEDGRGEGGDDEELAAEGQRQLRRHQVRVQREQAAAEDAEAGQALAVHHDPLPARERRVRKEIFERA